MKGMVFTEFLGFVAHQYGEDTVDDIIADSQLPSGGAYTAIGTYDHAEMVSLCTALAARTDESVPHLVRCFGTHLSGRFAHAYPAFFARTGNFFDFLESIEAHIHVEVRKLYPDAELPSIKVKERTPTKLLLEYRSPRRLGHLAEGLILGTAREFKVKVQILTSVLEEGTADEATIFAISLVNG
jgi:Haem-NO-binding